MKVVIFDDLLVRRQDEYRVPGLDLVFYENADDAIRVVEQEQPELVLMDYSMSAVLSGADAVLLLRREFSRERLRIVGISSDTSSNAHMMSVGANDALPKSHLRGFLSRLSRGARK